MAVTIAWGTRVINVPIASLGFVSTGIYKLSIDTFRLALKALEESEEGMCFPDTHRHNTEVSVAGITLARVIEIINNYTVTFEDGQYLVTLYGANSNIPDVVNFNQVSVRAVTTAGLIGTNFGTTEQEKLMSLPETTLTSEQNIKLMSLPETTLTDEQEIKLMALPEETVTSQDKTDIAASVWGEDTALLILKILKNKRVIKKNGAIWELIVYDDDNTMPILQKILKDKLGNNITDLVAGTLAQELRSSV